jgi:hypothetical protein
MRNFLTIILCPGLIIALLTGCKVRVDALPEAPVPEGPGLFEPKPLPGLADMRGTLPPVALHSETLPPAALPEGLPRLHGELIGTAWTFSDIRLKFLDVSTCLVVGGRVATLAPEGVNAPYTFDEGTVSLSVMGEQMTGTWDGEKLVIAGNPGEPIPSN